MKVRKLRINANMGQYNKDQVVSVKCDSGGTPLDRFWRRRVKDSEIDGCVSFVPDEKAKEKRSK